VAALAGAGVAAIGFVFAVLAGGAVLALAVRLLVDGLAAALGWLLPS
jgi:hypothetical protein